MTAASAAQTPIAVVGTGVIGRSWAALFLAHGRSVAAYDPAPNSEQRLIEAVQEIWPTLHALGADEQPNVELIRWASSVGDAVAGAGFVQENGPERLDLKAVVMAEIDESADAEAVIASSSSGLTPSAIQGTCVRHPERVLVGHPFNPPHLIPLVEVVGGSVTSSHAIDAAMAFYRSVGREPVHLRAETPGHVANRLQAALWREAFALVDSGTASVAEIDAIMTSGPGLRWSAIGPFASFHLSGGDGGIRHNLEHLGPPMVQWWNTLTQPELTPELIATVAEQMGDELDGRTAADLERERDRLLVDALRKRSTNPT